MSRYGSNERDFETGGVEAGQPPILAGGIERVGRRADAEMARDRGLLVPGIEAVGLHADGDVEIEPDLHAEPVRVRLAGGKLPVGVPLHEFDERDFGGVGPFAQAGAPGRRPAARHSSGHSHQGVLNLCRSTSKQAKRDSKRARSARNFSKSCRRSSARTALEGGERRAQGPPFQPRHGRDSRRRRMPATAPSAAINAGSAREIPEVFRHRCRAR